MLTVLHLLRKHMGAYTSTAFTSVTRAVATNEARLVMFGLGSAGQTTILYKLKLGRLILPSPTMDFNEETIQYKGTSFTICDIAGRLRHIRPYLQDADGIILVVDSANKHDFGSVKWFIDWCFANEWLKDRPLLILANKQDLSAAVDVSIIAKEIGITQRRGIDWFICPCSAIKGEGIYQGFDWMNNTLQRLRQVKTIDKAEKVMTLS